MWSPFFFLAFLFDCHRFLSFSLKAQRFQSYGRITSGAQTAQFAAQFPDSFKADLTNAAKDCILKKGDEVAPFICEKFPDISIDDGLLYSTDILKVNGKTEYLSLSRDWFTTCMPELSNAQCSVNRVSLIERDRVRMQWSVTFVPDSLTTLVWLGNSLPGVHVTFFNVLDKERERSQFSWESLKKFFGRIVSTGEMCLPHAVIIGTTDFIFRENEGQGVQNGLSDSSYSNDEKENVSHNISCRWTLVSVQEKLNLVRSIDNGILKNRKLATDLLEFIDARRPQNIGLGEWNDIIVSRINTRSVPGMGQFDIDGLDSEKQSELIGISNQILGWATAAVLLFGFVSATVVFDKMFAGNSEVAVQLRDGFMNNF
jgi:hypothetical protein